MGANRTSPRLPHCDFVVLFRASQMARKGKPIERSGRKATGPRPPKNSGVAGSRAAEVTCSAIRGATGILSHLSRWWRGFGRQPLPLRTLVGLLRLSPATGRRRPATGAVQCLERTQQTMHTSSRTKPYGALPPTGRRACARPGDGTRGRVAFALTAPRNARGDFTAGTRGERERAGGDTPRSLTRERDVRCGLRGDRAPRRQGEMCTTGVGGDSPGSCTFRRRLTGERASRWGAPFGAL